jgi:uncharacterized protein (UPF0332 family)
MNQADSAFLDKALQALEGAASEYANYRYDNSANRAYYACFQAAIFALQQNGITARGGQWGHDYVPAQFDGQLIHRRHVYPADLRGVLQHLRAMRIQADYDVDRVSRSEAARAIRLARRFVTEIRGGEPA